MSTESLLVACTAVTVVTTAIGLSVYFMSKRCSR